MQYYIICCHPDVYKHFDLHRAKLNSWRTPSAEWRRQVSSILTQGNTSLAFVRISYVQGQSYFAKNLFCTQPPPEFPVKRWARPEHWKSAGITAFLSDRTTMGGER